YYVCQSCTDTSLLERGCKATGNYFWSIGCWGRSGFAALLGGFMAQNIGWRWIFFVSATLSLIGMLMIRGTPESKAATHGSRKFDYAGVITFMIMMVALQVLSTQGAELGW